MWGEELARRAYLCHVIVEALSPGLDTAGVL